MRQEEATTLLKNTESAYYRDELCEFINGLAFKSADYVPASAETTEVFRKGYFERGGAFKEDDSLVSQAELF